jgi:hypothetical protein
VCVCGGMWLGQSRTSSLTCLAKPAKLSTGGEGSLWGWTTAEQSDVRALNSTVVVVSLCQRRTWLADGLAKGTKDDYKEAECNNRRLVCGCLVDHAPRSNQQMAFENMQNSYFYSLDVTKKKANSVCLLCTCLPCLISNLPTKPAR